MAGYVFVIQHSNGKPFQRDDAMGILATDSEAQAIRFAYVREEHGAEVVRYVAEKPAPEGQSVEQMARPTQAMLDAGTAAMLAFRKGGSDWTDKPAHAAEAAITAALFAQVPSEAVAIPTATDGQIAAWLERHDLGHAIRGTDARAAYEDAQSGHLIDAPRARGVDVVALEALAQRWQDKAADSWGEDKDDAARQACCDELLALIAGTSGVKS